ncbi:E3 ubiquitin-protein ligase CIP8-like [Coffea eugenioides]|uniref:E3 ubiquitin-protein ligase CIP8-like n=1 Tax=Coffea eugenioides TaxID=49369 RepID=UPI000F6147DE|nr:E3 ubiquitin-protein ligase CIP8-like [Coffea eugenioides]
MPAAAPLEDHSIEFRLAVPEREGYIGNPDDYVDTAGYEALQQNLAETDSDGRRGASPASKASVEALETTEIKSKPEALACAVCKDIVGVGGMVKKLPCDMGFMRIVSYHGWRSRNSALLCSMSCRQIGCRVRGRKEKESSAAAAACPEFFFRGIRRY